jgi:hypothetical protein
LRQHWVIGSIGPGSIGQHWVCSIAALGRTEETSTLSNCKPKIGRAFRPQYRFFAPIFSVYVREIQQMGIAHAYIGKKSSEMAIEGLQ